MKAFRLAITQVTTSIPLYFAMIDLVIKDYVQNLITLKINIQPAQFAQITHQIKIMKGFQSGITQG